VADIVSLDLVPGTRATALSSLAAAVAADPALLGVYRDLAGAVSQLRSLPGIGDWTAQYIALRALREPDAFPVADIGLQRAMTGLFDRCPTSAELLARAECWRPWRAYAAMHLWASLGIPVSAVYQQHQEERRVA
jgi:AraC family transcriptional regulator of adaptative response / DNA-3-methyladenine glycosylase II